MVSIGLSSSSAVGGSSEMVVTAIALMRGRASRRSHEVELDGENVDDVGGVVEVVRKVDVDIEADVVLCVA